MFSLWALDFFFCLESLFVLKVRAKAMCEEFFLIKLTALGKLQWKLFCQIISVGSLDTWKNCCLEASRFLLLQLRDVRRSSSRYKLMLQRRCKILIHFLAIKWFHYQNISVFALVEVFSEFCNEQKTINKRTYAFFYYYFFLFVKHIDKMQLWSLHCRCKL